MERVSRLEVFLKYSDKFESSGDSMTNKRHQVRGLTITLPDTSRPFFLFEGNRYTLRNFSEGGFGLWFTSKVPFKAPVGSRMRGEIAVSNKLYSVELSVAHVSEKTLGLRLEKCPVDLIRLFAALLRPAHYGAELKPHDMNQTVDAERGHVRLWYVSNAGTELLVWYQEPQAMVLGLQLCWLGKWVYRDTFDKAKTGFLRDGWAVGQGRVMGRDDLLLVHAEPEKRVLQEAAQLLGALPSPLPGVKLWQFLETGEQVFLPSDLFPAKKAA